MLLVAASCQASSCIGISLLVSRTYTVLSPWLACTGQVLSSTHTERDDNGFFALWPSRQTPGTPDPWHSTPDPQCTADPGTLQTFPVQCKSLVHCRFSPAHALQTILPQVLQTPLSPMHRRPLVMLGHMVHDYHSLLFQGGTFPAFLPGQKLRFRKVMSPVTADPGCGPWSGPRTSTFVGVPNCSAYSPNPTVTLQKAPCHGTCDDSPHRLYPELQEPLPRMTIASSQPPKSGDATDQKGKQRRKPGPHSTALEGLFPHVGHVTEED